MLQEVWEETGIKPPALTTQPTLVSRWSIPYKVWVELSGSRNYHMGGAAEIPFSEFFMWALAHRYTPLEMECMWEDVHVIDKVWLGAQADHKKDTQEAAEIAKRQGAGSKKSSR